MANKFFTYAGSRPISAYNDTERELIDAYIELGKYRLYTYHKGMDRKVAGSREALFSTMDSSYDYSETNNTLLKKHLAYAAKCAMISDDVAALKSPRVLENQIFRNKFFGIIDQALPAVITSTVNYAFMTVADVRNVGWGEQLHFKVSSPDIFVVNGIGKNIRNGATQRLFSSDVLLTPKAQDVTVSVDWYQIAAGLYDIGEWMFRISMSYATDITTKVYNAIDASFSGLPTPLQIAGPFTDEAFISITQRVRAANGGLPVVAMGTLAALSNVLPENDFLKMELGSDYAQFGYVGRYKGVNLIEVPQALVPGTANSTLDFAINDNRIYLFSMDSDKPVKIAFEGEVITKDFDGLYVASGETTAVVHNMYDVKIATSSTYGIMDLA